MRRAILLLLIVAVVAWTPSAFAAKRVQVLSVTHAPQVAAQAGVHFLIAKSGGSDRVSTSVAEMDQPARLEEIARMLAGETITAEARAAAERLLRERVT